MSVKKLLLAIVLGALSSSSVVALWPEPKQMKTGSQTLFIDSTVSVTYNGQTVKLDSSPTSAHCLFNSLSDSTSSPQAPLRSNCTSFPGQLPNSAQIVEAGIRRAFATLFKNNLVPWKLRERNSDFEPETRGYDKRLITQVLITQTEKNGTLRPLAGQIDESYRLEIYGNGTVSLTAPFSTGLLYGLETFVQLFFQHSSGRHWYTSQAPVVIDDEPLFPHRGVLFDLARNWFEVDDIKRTMDGMAMTKMNRLHLHMTDSQSWPLEVPALPHLAERGAYRKGLSYSPADIASIYSYGIARGIEVIMEIDMPGHIGVVELAYDNLITAYDAKPYNVYCAEPPCGAFRLNSTAVYDFLGKLLDDVLPRISPYSAYFHTGGDELNKEDYAIDPTVGSNKTEIIQPLLQKFIDFAHGRIRAAGLAPLVWEEMATDWQLTLGDDVVIQSWLGGTAVKDLAEKGHKVVDSNYNFWYLDCGRGAWLNSDNGPAFQQFYPFNDWCGPLKSWRLIYSHDPLYNVAEDKQKNVLGGEVAVWTETIDSMNMDVVLWPRAAAAGEVLWSGRQDSSGKNRSQYTAAPRLAELRERMVARGLRPEPVQMIFCTQGNATECSQTADEHGASRGSQDGPDSEATRVGLDFSWKYGEWAGVFVSLIAWAMMM